MPSVHIAITRRVLPGKEAEFDAKLMEFVRDSMTAEGMVGIHILRPVPNTGDREYGILRSFASDEAADDFYRSELFAGWLRDVAPLVEGEPLRRRLCGLEAFFRSGSGRLPPRWKMAAVTFLGVLPTALLWFNVVPAALPDQHWLVRLAATSVLMVATLTWVVMPQLTRLFRRWLLPETTRQLGLP